MYDRAPRILVATAPTSSTPPTVGPGVYWNEKKEIRNGMLQWLHAPIQFTMFTDYIRPLIVACILY